MKKRVLSFVLALCLLAACLPLSASAAAVSGTCGTNLTWTLDNGVLTISGTGDMANYPMDGTEGSMPPWIGKGEITKLVIESGVTSISRGVFYKYETLSEVSLSDTLVKIEGAAFSNCPITKFSVDPANTSFVVVNDVLFTKDMKKLLRFPQGKTVASYAIPEGVEIIGQDAFFDFSGNSLSIPTSLVTVESGAFFGCAFDTLTFNENLKTIGDSAFWSANIGSVDFGKSLVSLGASVFGMGFVKEITLPKTLTSIGNNAFQMTGLKTVNYGGSRSDWAKISIGSNNSDLDTATIRYTASPSTPVTPVTPVTPTPDPDPEPEPIKFSDVSPTAYYAEAVEWAVANGITSGTGNGKFSPNISCTRAQAVTFLWRAAGSPEPTSNTSFGDVKAGTYYEKAVKWAVEKGITSGTGNGKFSPDTNCSRAQIVTFLYRAEGKPTVSNGGSFSDVSANEYYSDAVAWAIQNEITSGTGNGKFSPDNSCTRGQIVTFLYRDMT